MSGSRSGLTTRGRCLLAAGFAAALCALLLDERDLLRIAAFAVALPLLARLVVGRGRVGLRATRDLVPARLAAGETGEAHLAVHSTRHIGTGVLIEDELPPALDVRPRFLVRLPRGRTVQRYYPLRPQQRGVHQVGPLRARVTDPFGLAECGRELAGSTPLVVTPVVATLTGMPAGGGLGSGADGAGPGRSRPRRDADEDSTVVRGYRHGDDLRRVHWRTTARRDELMVRVEERPCRDGAVVLLDDRISAHRGSGPRSSLEYAISLAAGVWIHLHRHGHRTRLVTAGGRVLADSAHGTGAHGIGYSADAALAALAALHPTHHHALPGDGVLGESRDVVAVLGAGTPADVAQLLAVPARGQHGYAVLLDVAAWTQPVDQPAPDPAETARALRTAGWSVEVAGPQRPHSSVWEQLCAGTRVTLRAAR